MAGAHLWQPLYQHHRRLPHLRLQQRRGEPLGELDVAPGDEYNCCQLASHRKRCSLNPPCSPCPSAPPLQLALRFLEAWSTLAGFQRSTHAPAKYERCMEAVLAHGLR